MTAFRLACGLFSDVKSFIDENYVAQQHEVEYETNRRRPREEIVRAHNNAAPHQPIWAEYERADTLCRPVSAKPKQNTSSPLLHDMLEDIAPSFSEKVLSLLSQREGKYSEIYNEVGMSRQLFNKIITNKNYFPKKNTAIQIAVGLHLNYEQTQELLSSAGYMLSHSDKRDVILEYFLKQPNYQIDNIDTVMFSEGLACVGKYE